jgi:hypothetical protein
MHLQVSGGEENGRNTRASSLASPRLAGRGVAWQGEAMGAGSRCACE